jgi:predicted negative regulator of RcsB-dependent stress response
MAIDDLLDEHEQNERVKKWLQTNAFGLIGGVGLGLGAIYGWTWWKDQQSTERLKAADAYQTMIRDIKAGKLDDAKAKAANAKDGNYAVLAALDLAKAQVDAGKRDDAIATLRAAQADSGVLASIVAQRLARLSIDAGKHDEALKLVAGSEDAVAIDIRGDAYFAQGKLDKAREAYASALGKLDEGAPQRRLVELKLTQAGGKPPEVDKNSPDKKS